MKKGNQLKRLAVMTALVLAFSGIGCQVLGATETETYIFTYDDGTTDPNQKLEAGETYKLLTSGSNAWFLTNAGNYTPVWLVNDAKSLDGNYGAVYCHFSQQQFLITRKSEGSMYVDPISNDFCVEFSFNSLSCEPGKTVSDRGVTSFQFCIYPAATFQSDGNPRETAYSIFSYNKGTITGCNGASTSFDAVLDTWYDLKVSFSFSTTIPTYTVQMKKSADSTYTTLFTESMPESWDYSQGLKTGGILALGMDATLLATDNVRVATISQYDVVLSAGEHGTLSFATAGLTGTSASVNPGTTVDVSIAPEVGYEIDTITLNGVSQPVKGNAVQLTVTLDSNLAVTFKEIPKTEIGLTEGDCQQTTSFTYQNGEVTETVNRKNIVQYFRTNNYNDGKTYSCGINLTDTANGQILKLPVKSEIAPNTCYGVRIYGDPMDEMIANNSWQINVYSEEKTE